MHSTRTLPCLGLLAFASCTFGAQRTILDAAAVSSVPAVATNTDANLMFVGDADGRMVQADPATGAVQGSVWLWNGAASTPVAITADGEDSRRVWALHADGFVVNWSDGPSITQWFWPPPLGAAERTYCDLDHARDGDFYLSVVDDDQGVVWRRDGQTQVWSSTFVGGSGEGCPRVAHDLFDDELYVLREGFMLERRDPDSLALTSSVPLDADGGAMADVDVFGQAAVGAGTTANPNLPDGTPLPGFNMTWSFDADTGVAVDAKILSGAAPSSVHITVNEATSSAEMLVGSLAGTSTVRGVLLL